MLVKLYQVQLVVNALALVFSIDNTSDAARHAQRYNIVRVILSPRDFTGIQIGTSLSFNEEVRLILRREE